MMSRKAGPDVPREAGHYFAVARPLPDGGFRAQVC